MDTATSREDLATAPAAAPGRSAAAASRQRSKLLRMGSSLDSSVRSKMRHVRDKLRQHAIQQSTHWPPPCAIFGERYAVADAHPLLVAGGRSLSSSSATSTPARCRRSVPPRGAGLPRRQSSESDSVYSSEAGDSAHGGVVCSELDLKAILSDYKGAPEKAGSSSGFFSLGCGEEQANRTASEGRLAERSRSFTFAAHKRRHFRKQVSFDDRDYYIYHAERKVSAIQEEIELAAMQATQGPSSNHRTSKLSIGEVSVDEASPEDENRPLLGASPLAPPAASGPPVAVAKEPPPEKPAPPQQPKEVEYDEHGQTWEIYGAEFDPNILGQAIQSHLDTIIKKDLSAVFSDMDIDEDGEEHRLPPPPRSRSAEGDEARNRITRLCSIFCLRSHQRSQRKALR